MKKNLLNSGQSLIELLVALTLIMLVVVAVVGLAAVSIKTSYFAKRETTAKRYAEEAMEWLREQKKSNWTDFLFAKSTTTGQKYCFNSLSWSSAGACTTTFGGIYKREATLLRSSDNKNVTVTVVVSWTDSSGGHKTTLVSVFTAPD